MKYLCAGTAHSQFLLSVRGDQAARLSLADPGSEQVNRDHRVRSASIINKPREVSPNCGWYQLTV